MGLHSFHLTWVMAKPTTINLFLFLCDLNCTFFCLFIIIICFPLHFPTTVRALKWFACYCIVVGVTCTTRKCLETPVEAWPSSMARRSKTLQRRSRQLSHITRPFTPGNTSTIVRPCRIVCHTVAGQIANADPDMRHCWWWRRWYPMQLTSSSLCQCTTKMKMQLQNANANALECTCESAWKCKSRSKWNCRHECKCKNEYTTKRKMKKKNTSVDVNSIITTPLP